MKRYMLEFIHNGLLACGFGPIMWTIVYFFLEKNGVVEILTVSKVIFEIVTVTLLAFIVGGINIVYKIEKLPLMAATFIHGVVLYLDYVIIYLFNGWLNFGPGPLLVFTVCFCVGYAIIWTVIYFTINRNAARMNKKLYQLRNQNESDWDER